MSSSTKAIIVLIVIVLAEGAWIYFHNPGTSLEVNKEKQLRDSIQAGRIKYDSLSNVITLKDSLYDALQKTKPAVEYYAKERLVYVNKSDAPALDKFIRSNWDK